MAKKLQGPIGGLEVQVQPLVRRLSGNHYELIGAEAGPYTGAHQNPQEKPAGPFRNPLGKHEGPHRKVRALI